jgi:hypothetical protein
MDNIVKHYTSNLKKNAPVQTQIQAFEANPNLQDYLNQYIYRYFVRKRNEENGLIYEISKLKFDEFKNNSLYITAKLKWKIYGDRTETEMANKKSVEYVMTTISNLDTYINNYLKFWKN